MSTEYTISLQGAAAGHRDVSLLPTLPHGHCLHLGVLQEVCLLLHIAEPPAADPCPLARPGLRMSWRIGPPP